MTVRFATTLAFVFCVALPLRAQDVEAPSNLPPPVSLSYVDGDVQYLNAGAAERADAPAMLNDGDGVRTARGRAELVFGDGSVLHLDENTAVDLLSDRRLRVLGGRVVLRASPAAGDGYIIDTPAASVRVDSRGEYNVLVDDGRQTVDVAVARGVAEIELASERVVIRAGEEARLDRPGDRPQIRAFNSARLDAFERWSLTRYEGEELSPASRRLPTELRAYGQSFDRYGRWDYVAPYGQVWYPSVAVGWRPYYNGGWRHTRYGWTWYGADPWAWPTHHYGRWQSSGGRWFWVPARVWGPAWVSWAHAPGYVSWAPLGWDSRPVVPFYLRAGYVNPDRWRAWTVMPRGYLGRPGHIRPWVVDGYRTPRVSRAAFVQQALPPQRPANYAVRRDGFSGSSSAAPRGSVDRAVPRGSYVDRGAGTRSGSAVAPQSRATGAERRDPRATADPQRESGRTFEQQWGGTARPRSTNRPSAQPEPQAQPQDSQGAVRRQDAPRRQDSPAYAPPASPTPQSRPRWDGRGPNDVSGDRARGRSGSERGEARPRYERPEAAAPAPAPAPRAEGARSRGESGSGRGSSEGRARGGDSGGGKGSEGSSGTRSGSARRPPGQ
jgi:hypothetical protein